MLDATVATVGSKDGGLLLSTGPGACIQPRHPGSHGTYDTDTFLGCGYCHEAFPEKRELQARDGKGQPQQHFLSRMPHRSHSVNLSPVGTGSYQDDP